RISWTDLTSFISFQKRLLRPSWQRRCKTASPFCRIVSVMSMQAFEIIGSNGTTVPRGRGDLFLVPVPPREVRPIVRASSLVARGDDEFILARRASENAERPARSTLQREHAIARLRAIERYTEGWDGEHGAPPRPRAVADAMMLLANLTRDFSFSAAPEPDGAVELSMQVPAGRATLVFEGNGKAAVFIRREGANYVCTEYQLPGRIGADRELLNILQPFADAP